MNPPDWLRQHGGDVKLGCDKKTWYVVIAGKPLYDLITMPAAGKHSCIIRQTNNGQLVDCKGVYTSSDEALRGGMEDLKSYLGWG